MPNKLIIDTVDLRIYPETIIAPEANERAVFGDMHGNALKLLYLLIKFNFVRLSKEAYEKFRDNYLKSTPLKTDYEGLEDRTMLDPLSAEDLVLCKGIIDSLVVNKSSTLCLAGDLLADRGKSDLLTLWIIEKLSLAELDMEIILSNHDMILIACIENAASICDPSLPRFLQRKEQRHSLDSLIELIKTGLVPEEEVRRLYHVYKQHLRLFSICKNAGEVCTIITHAPVSLNVLVKIGELYGIPFKASPAKHLIATARQINLKFQEEVQAGSVTTRLVPVSLYTKEEASAPTHPIMKLIWNRRIPKDKHRPSSVSRSILEYAHGHTEVDDANLRPYVYPLDNSNLGTRHDFVKLHKSLHILKPQTDETLALDASALNPETNPVLKISIETGEYPHGHCLMGPCLVLLQERAAPVSHPISSVFLGSPAAAAAVSGAGEERFSALVEAAAMERESDAAAGAGASIISGGRFFSAPASTPHCDKAAKAAISEKVEEEIQAWLAPSASMGSKPGV